jgi:hypothetical protein
LNLEEFMATLREWIHRPWGTFRRSDRDRDLEEELKIHLELAAEDMRRRSRSSEDAERMARLRAGGSPRRWKLCATDGRFHCFLVICLCR